MKLEEVLKQEKFDNIHEKLALNFIYTANRIESKINCLLKGSNLSSQQYNVLRILKGQYPTPVTLLQIKERMLDKESNVSRLVEKLFQAGLINRKQCPNDRRQLDIILTHKGHELLDYLNPKVKDEIEKQFNITKEKAGQLNDMIDNIR